MVVSWSRIHLEFRGRVQSVGGIINIIPALSSADDHPTLMKVVLYDRAIELWKKDALRDMRRAFEVPNK